MKGPNITEMQAAVVILTRTTIIAMTLSVIVSAADDCDDCDYCHDCPES